MCNTLCVFAFLTPYRSRASEAESQERATGSYLGSNGWSTSAYLQASAWHRSVDSWQALPLHHASVVTARAIPERSERSEGSERRDHAFRVPQIVVRSLQASMPRVSDVE